jgi:hypothetical protein
MMQPQHLHDDAAERTFIESALSYISPESRDEWLRAGMALHSSGHPWARAAWDAWARQSSKFDVRSQNATWASFGRNGGARVTVGWIVEEARRNGFRGHKGQSADSRYERRPAPRRLKPTPAPPPDLRSRHMAQEIFAETVEPRRTLGEHYLEIERRLGDVFDDVLALTLRFHPACPFRDGETLVRAPALVAALRDPRLAMGACSRLGEMEEIERRFLRDPEHIVAVQRIRLDDKGRKVERRSLGPLGNGVVFIGSIWEQFYSATATIAEGVESALAARKLGFTGVVAMTGCSRFRTFDPPWIWQSLTICAENDAASESAWRAAVPRWRAAGHKMRVVAPNDGLKDANSIFEGGVDG